MVSKQQVMGYGLWVLVSALTLTTAQAQTRPPQKVDLPWATMRGDSLGTAATRTAPLPPWREIIRVSNPHRLTPVVAANNAVFFGSADHNVYAYHLPMSPSMLPTAVPAGSLTILDYMRLTQMWRKLWQFSTGADVEAAPAVAGDTIYAASTDHHHYALDAATGKPRWQLRFEDDARAAPVVDNGVIYVGADDRIFRAVDAARGGVLWAKELGGEIRAPAVVGRDAVYVPCADHHVYALSRSSGEEIWKADVGDDATAPLMLMEGKLFGVNLLGKLFALDRANGKLLWSHPYPIMVGTAPAYADGRIFFTRDDGNVIALDAAGQRLWTTAKRMGAPVATLFGPNGAPVVNNPSVPRVRSAGSPVVGGRYVYVNAGVPQSVFLLEAATGKVVESPRTGAAMESPFGSANVQSPVLQDDDSPPLSSRARRLGQAHLSLYGDFVLVALPNSVSIIGEFPLEVSSQDAGALRLRDPSRQPDHVGAVLDIYAGPSQPLSLRSRFEPGKFLRTSDHMIVTLDGRRSGDWLGHRLTRSEWIEDLGNEPIIRRLFGIGNHVIYLTVIDEEGAESESATFQFRVFAPLDGSSGFGVTLPPGIRFPGSPPSGGGR